MSGWLQRAGMLCAVALLALLVPMSHAQTVTSEALSATQLYNLGNSYARAGKPGLAVLNYERARLLAPNDADIDANLNFVRASAKLPPEISSWLDRTVRAVDPTWAAALGIAGLLMLGAALLAAKLRYRRALLRWATALVGVLLIAIPAYQGALLWPVLHSAVVIADSAPALVSPVPMGEPLFVLPQAEVVRVVAQREDFLLVQTKNDRSGWVLRASLGQITSEHRQ